MKAEHLHILQHSLGCDEYRACLREMKPALEHHYASNSHHPEHYSNGIQGMSLFDLLLN